MRNRIIAAILLAGVLVTSLCVALASPGSSEDPFVTLSYLTGTFVSDMEQAMLEQAQKGTAKIEEDALNRLAELSNSYTNDDTSVRDGLYSDTFFYLTLSRSETLTLPTGSSLMFEAGVVALNFSSGCLVDVTTGTTVSAGGTLTAGHRYIAAENTNCTITAKSDSVYLSVCGYYDLQRTGISYTPFIDIVAPVWYADAVQYAYEEGLVNGTSATTYAPMMQMNRAMLATLLSRMAGVQGTPADAGFTDVPAGQWYTNGVNWAYSAGIVKGTSATTFAPNTALNREQLAVFLYRYAQYLGKDTPTDGDLTKFPDADNVSGYAKDALSWAVGVGLINGKNNILAPQDNTTRAEVATVLYRFDTLLP